MSSFYLVLCKEINDASLDLVREELIVIIEKGFH